ncbi:hypothetical protein LJE86_12685 [bacterium BMS3Abin03]|nr:hypothetical protein [bacterium BMS3Abin03]MCG6960445.1 hypothetical protein [bacterium BMS3Abin03]
MEINKIELRKVRDFGALIGITFEFLRQNFKLLFKSCFYFAGPFILLAGVFMGLYQSSALNFRNMSGLQGLGINLLAYMLFVILAVIMLYAVIYSFILLYMERGPGNFDVNDVWQKTKSNYWKIFLTGIGYSFFVLIATLFFIIPGIYLGITLSLIFMVRLSEGIGFFAAFDRCLKLISKNWWFTFGFILVMGLIQGFIGFIFYIPNYIAMFALTLSGLNNPNQNSPSHIIFIITSIISSFNFLLTAISVVGISFHYYNLVERKEAPSLLEKIETIQ